MSKYIILDRDGVINYDSNDYIKNKNEWKPIPRSLEAISLLSKNSYKVIVISNQSGIKRKIIQYSDLLDIQTKLIYSCRKEGGKIYATYYCFDLPNSSSHHRKPKPGMYLEISERLNIDLSSVFAIGDSPRDMTAALSSGCIPLGVRTGNGSKIEKEMPHIQMFDDLYDAATYVIGYDKQFSLDI